MPLPGGFVGGMGGWVVGASSCSAGRCTVVFVLRLHHDAIERSRCHHASLHHADVAQGVARVGTASPALAVVLTLKDHAGFRAGRQQALIILIVADRADVLVGETILHVLPAGSAVRAAECALARSEHDLPIRGNAYATNAADLSR